MDAAANRSDEPILQIVGPTDNWILERLARRLAAKLPYGEFVPWKPQPGRATGIVYYVNYALYNEPSGLIDMGFFTHLDQGHQFLERARRMDLCVCMCRLYTDWLRSQGVHTVAYVPMGFDYYRYQPRLVLGVIGRLDHPRKGRRLVECLRQLPFVEVVATEGQVPEEQLREVYQRVDYVLIPATVEGGPMSLLEGLAMGKPVIAPDSVGIVPELTPSEHVRCYHTGDAEDLVRVVTACYAEKRQRTAMVRDRTWDRWAENHHRLFMLMLRARGLATPEPAPGFRFGLLGELEIPAGLDTAPLEEALDQAASHLFHGRSAQARGIVEQTAERYPCIRSLLDKIPAA